MLFRSELGKNWFMKSDPMKFITDSSSVIEDVFLNAIKECNVGHLGAEILQHTYNRYAAYCDCNLMMADAKLVIREDFSKGKHPYFTLWVPSFRKLESKFWRAYGKGNGEKLFEKFEPSEKEELDKIKSPQHTQYMAIRSEIVNIIDEFSQEVRSRHQIQLTYGTAIDALKLIVREDKNINSEGYFLQDYLQVYRPHSSAEENAEESKKLESLAKELSGRINRFFVDAVSRFNLTNKDIKSISHFVIYGFEASSRILHKEDIAERYHIVVNPYTEIWKCS